MAEKAVQRKTAPLVERSFEFGLAYFRLSVPHPLTAFALGLAFSPQFCPAFLLSSSNRRPARCGDAFALAGSSGTTRCGFGGAVLLPSLRPIPLHPDADGTPFSGGHLSTPGPGTILRRCSTVVPVAQIRKCPEQFIRFGPKLREPGLRPFSGKRFHVDRHVGIISTVDSRSKRSVSCLVFIFLEEEWGNPTFTFTFTLLRTSQVPKSGDFYGSYQTTRVASSIGR